MRHVSARQLPVQQWILIVDFGSQVTQLIARRVRECNVYCEIVPYFKAEEKLKDANLKGIILSGGPASVAVANTPKAPSGCFTRGVPVLGICYGYQAMCAQLGGKVASGNAGEFGAAQVKFSPSCKLFSGLDHSKNTKGHLVWMSHGDVVTQLPQGFTAVGASKHAPLAAVADEARGLYGLQFHPEVTHTPCGKKILENFVHEIANCSPDWTMADFSKTAVEKIRKQVGDKRVLCALSGGVDSTVVAALLHKALQDRPNQLLCVFVDTGLLRKDEGRQVVKLFNDSFKGLSLVYEQAEDLFLNSLKGVRDPEKKRKIIGKLFIDVFEKAALQAGGADFLAQGTLYPDVIESISFTGSPSATIKSHHNVGGLPERMRLRLIEPLRALFKDEVRALGRALGLPAQAIARHPFPGPGLAVRIPGSLSRRKVRLLQEADAIYIAALHEAGLYDAIWQAFAVLLPVRSVGVMGDRRSYGYTCVLRAVVSQDGMTARSYPFTHDFLDNVSTRIINEVRGINRVLYDVTSKPPATIEWE